MRVESHFLVSIKVWTFNNTFVSDFVWIYINIIQEPSYLTKASWLMSIWFKMSLFQNENLGTHRFSHLEIPTKHQYLTSIALQFGVGPHAIVRFIHIPAGPTLVRTSNHLQKDRVQPKQGWVMLTCSRRMRRRHGGQGEVWWASEQTSSRVHTCTCALSFAANLQEHRHLD